MTIRYDYILEIEGRTKIEDDMKKRLELHDIKILADLLSEDMVNYTEIVDISNSIEVGYIYRGNEYGTPAIAIVIEYKDRNTLIKIKELAVEEGSLGRVRALPEVIETIVDLIDDEFFNMHCVLGKDYLENIDGYGVGILNNEQLKLTDSLDYQKVNFKMDSRVNSESLIEINKHIIKR